MNKWNKFKREMWIMAAAAALLCGQSAQAAQTGESLQIESEIVLQTAAIQSESSSQTGSEAVIQSGAGSSEDLQTVTEEGSGNGGGATEPGTDGSMAGGEDGQNGTDGSGTGTEDGKKDTEQGETEPKETEQKDTEPKETEPKDTEQKDTEPKDTEQKDSEKDTEQKDTEKKEPQTEKDQKEEGPYLEIDNSRIYEGMDKTFREGYTPVVKDKKVLLVVPFLELTPIKGGEIQAEVNLGDTATAPFVFKNYNTTLKKETYRFVGNVQLDKEGKPVTKKEEKGEQSEVKAYVMNLEMDLKEEVQAGSYPVIITFTGKTESGKKVSKKCTFYVTVKPEIKDDAKGDGQGSDVPVDGGGDYGGYSGGGGGDGTQTPLPQPKVLLEDYSISQVPMLAGQEASVRVQFLNTNKSTYIQNIKVTVSAQNNTLKFNRKSFYIDKVGAKESFEVSFVAEVLKDTTENTDTLVFTVEYEDKDAKAITETEDILLQITQPIELEAENLNIPANVYASETIPVSMKILNLSRIRVYNVRYTVEAEGLMPLESAFVGNMEAGTSAEGNAKVFIGTKDMKDAAETKDRGSSSQSGSSGNGQSGSGQDGNSAGSQSGEGQDGNSEGSQSGEDQAQGNGGGSGDAGQTGTTAEKYGPTSGVVTLSYEDEFGETYTTEIPFTTTINKPEILKPVVPKDEPETAGQWWLSILAGLGGMALVGGIAGIRRLILRKADVYGRKDI